MTLEPDQRPLGESLYRVLILNDNETPMEFVVDVMERFFAKDHEAAVRTMLYIHHHGMGDCGGVYRYEAAKHKVTEVMDFAREHQHPLQSWKICSASWKICSASWKICSASWKKSDLPWSTIAGRAI